MIRKKVPQAYRWILYKMGTHKRHEEASSSTVEERKQTSSNKTEKGLKKPKKESTGEQTKKSRVRKPRTRVKFGDVRDAKKRREAFHKKKTTT